MQISLVLGAAACFALLYLKYKTAPPEMRDRSTVRQRLKTARVLIAALLALLAINYKLANTHRSLTGDKSHEPTLLERFVLSTSD